MHIIVAVTVYLFIAFYSGSFAWHRSLAVRSDPRLLLLRGAACTHTIGTRIRNMNARFLAQIAVDPLVRLLFLSIV